MCLSRLSPPALKPGDDGLVSMRCASCSCARLAVYPRCNDPDLHNDVLSNTTRRRNSSFPTLGPQVFDTGLETELLD